MFIDRHIFIKRRREIGTIMRLKSGLAILIALLAANQAVAWAKAPEIRWSSPVGHPVYATPRYRDGRVYLTTTQSQGPNVFALNATTGAIIWRYATAGAMTVSPTVSKSQVFVASDIGATHFMRALGAKDGALVWQYTRNQPPQCMCSHNATLGANLVFAQTDGHDLYAFAPMGNMPSRRLWQFKSDGARLTRPATAQGLVVFGSADDDLYGLDAATGARRWIAKTGYSFVAPPLVVNDRVIDGNRGGTVHAYALATGKSLWSFATNGPIKFAPIASGSRVYLVSEDRHVYALNAITGKLIWQHRMADVAMSPPVLQGKRLIVANRAGDAIALNAQTGALLWRVRLHGLPLSAPLLWGKDVVFKVDDHMIVAISTMTGTMRWRYHTSAVLTKPIAADGAIVVASSAGQVVGLR
jgi:outer membrane protein assembly factor BamB